MRRRVWVRGVVVAAMVGSAVTLSGGPANAATGVTRSGDVVTVNTAAGVSNDITIGLSASKVVIRDATDTVTAGAGCFAVGDGSVTCSVNVGSATVVVNAGDGNDTITKTGNLAGDLRGGPGSDVIDGGPTPRNNILNGGADPDLLLGGPDFDQMIGGPGNDTFSGGGGTRDSVSYQDSGSGVVVSIDDVGDDGATGEGDNVLTSVENIVGSQFGDAFFGSVAANTMNGLGGVDFLGGSFGDDTLVGGTGADILFGDVGNDSLHDVDGFSDTLNGGFNTDTCNGDAIDVKAECEA
ncbi:calcium-binding protein [Streptomyces sp. NPDC017991]|uniref:calcium-binding protein n=1 Tax=Streptomyces sp. NPDC017991 TaxID=3365026 RepID=UPI00378ED0F7